jgi:hypothetical protein
MDITLIIRLFGWFSSIDLYGFNHPSVSFACFSSGLFLSHPSSFVPAGVAACGRDFLVGREAEISASHHHRRSGPHERWRAGDGPARLNAGEPLDVRRLGATTTTPLPRVWIEPSARLLLSVRNYGLALLFFLCVLSLARSLSLSRSLFLALVRCCGCLFVCSLVLRGRVLVLPFCLVFFGPVGRQ